MALKKETKKAPAAKAAKPVAKKAAAKAEKPAAKKAAPKGKASDVEFKVFSPASGSVAIAGDFNGWKPEALKKGKDGNWSGKFKLSAGTHQYKIVFDGQYWKTDEANPECISDGHGGENSIRRV
jgi:1,4-alpha-glucan branching enzyme